MIRSASVKGQFYPASVEELQGMISLWKRKAPAAGKKVKAVIVPHAGYVFSGECAWMALSQLAFDTYKRVVVIGPSHRFPFQGCSIFSGGGYESLPGEQPGDTVYANHLAGCCGIPCYIDAHLEHSTEVQFPLISALAPELPIVEIVYGSNALEDLNGIVKTVLEDPETCLVISSDLSHYHSEELAHKIDAEIVSAVESMDTAVALQGEACGRPGIMALLKNAKEMHFQSELVDYRTSANSPYGDSDRVVGYLSALIYSEA